MNKLTQGYVSKGKELEALPGIHKRMEEADWYIIHRTNCPLPTILCW